MFLTFYQDECVYKMNVLCELGLCRPYSVHVIRTNIDSRIEFACFSFHVGLLLSTFRLSNRTTFRRVLV